MLPSRASSAARADALTETLARSTSPDELDALLAAHGYSVDDLLVGNPERARNREIYPNERCSFCDISNGDCRQLIAGPWTYICDTCCFDAAVLSNAARAIGT